MNQRRPESRWRAGMTVARAGMFFGMVWLLAGCVAPPSLPETTPLSASAREQYRLDQAQRHRLPDWEVEGVLRVREKDVTRALRASLRGKGREAVRLRVYGPFRQLEMELFSLGERLQVIHPGRREVWRLPATAEAMARVVGIPFSPGVLLEILLGLDGEATHLVKMPLSAADAMGVGDETGIDAQRGLLGERRFQAPGVGGVRVQYVWPESPLGASDASALPMPEEVRVEIVEPAPEVEAMGLTALEMTLGRWNLSVDRALDPLAARETPLGFSIVEGW